MTFFPAMAWLSILDVCWNDGIDEFNWEAPETSWEQTGAS